MSTVPEKRPLRKNPWYVLALLIGILAVLQLLAMIAGNLLPKPVRVFEGIDTSEQVVLTVEGKEYPITDKALCDLLAQKTLPRSKKTFVFQGTTSIQWNGQKKEFGVMMMITAVTYINHNGNTYVYPGNLIKDLGLTVPTSK